MHIKPAGSPGCWGDKFQDGDLECRQCRFNDTCRPAMLARLTGAGPVPRPSLPAANQPLLPPPPSKLPPPPLPTVPLPSKPYYVQPPPQPQAAYRTPSAPSSTTAMVPTSQAQTAHVQPTYYQQSTGYSLPSRENPNPLAHMHRPGAPAPSYYLTQYPGESVAQRVVKNVLLRMAEAVFQELTYFFRHWTWPK